MKISLSTRLFLGFVLLLVLFSGLQVWSLLGLQKLGVDFENVHRIHLHLSHQVLALETAQTQLLLLLKNLTAQDPDAEVRKNPTLLARWLRVTMEKRNESWLHLREVIDAHMAQLQKDEPTYVRELTPQLTQLETEYTQVQDIWSHAFSSGLEHTDFKATYRKENLLLSRIRQLVGTTRNRVRHMAMRIEDSERELLRMQIMLLSTAFLLALGIIFLSYRPLRMLARLTQSARHISRGDFSKRIEVTSHDELGELAAEFNAMTEAILEREERLIRSEQLAAAGKLSAQIAHELRNPLAALSFQVELAVDLCRELPTSNERDELQTILQKIQKEIDRLTSISEEYLVFARLPKPQRKPIDANVFLRDFYEFLAGEMELGNVRVHWVSAPENPQFLGDENLMRQVVLNLVRNAREAMPNGGEIKLRCRKENNYVVISVRDTGPGISPEVRSRMFDAFYTTKTHGTGLGLTLCLQIVHEHQGTLDVADSLDKGAVFEIRLPAIVASEEEPMGEKNT